MRSVVALCFLALTACIAADAQEFNNKTKQYVLVSQTEARTDVKRRDRNQDRHSGIFGI